MSGPVPRSMMMTGGVDTGAPIANSCRFNDDDSAYTQAAAPGAPDDGTLWTYSGWVKRGNLGTAQALITGMVDNNNGSWLYFNASDELEFQDYVGAAVTAEITTVMKFRDPSAWYHILVVYDSDQAASTDRMDIYVNGVEVTWTETNAIDSADVSYIGANQVQAVGRRSSYNDMYFDGYMAEVHFLDGVRGATTDFGYFNPQGHWVPKTPVVTYGTNGFHLDFAVAPGTGNGAGTDVSGNANHFTDSGLAANDQVSDTPTNNFCVMTPLAWYNAQCTFADGNLHVTTPTGGAAAWGSMEIPTHGKWYWEVKLGSLDNTNASEFVGISATGAHNRSNAGPDDWNRLLDVGLGTSNEGMVWDGTSNSISYTTTIADNTVIQIAVDMDNGYMWFGEDGTWLNSGDPAAGTGYVLSNLLNEPYTPGDRWAPVIYDASGTHGFTGEFDFGQHGFAHTKPSGFKRLCTADLSDPIDAPILKGSDYFDVLTYAGNDTNPRSLTGLDFQPDLVWIKNRNDSYNHYLADSARGGGIILFPDAAAAETAAPTQGDITAFTSDGFTVDIGSSVDDAVNSVDDTYVAWCWKEAVKAGFDIVTHSGTGVGKTEAHSLGAAPGLVISKSRTLGSSWAVLHMDTLDASTVPITDEETDVLLLDTTAALADNANYWNDAAPDASNFSVLSANATNAGGSTYVVYLWREVPGFSRFGAYVGNGSTDGTFVWTGFRPRFVMVKYLGVNNWCMHDSVRDAGANPVDKVLFGDLPNAEGSGNNVDFLANGFKLRTTSTNYNVSAGEYVFMAFAEHPFKYARAF